jgi:DNA-binding XRE family transcriptional regulator
LKSGWKRWNFNRKAGGALIFSHWNADKNTGYCSFHQITFIIFDIYAKNVYNINSYFWRCEMAKKTVTIMPQTEEILAQVGEQIKLARLRRKLTAELVAERAGISRTTLWAVEKGTPSVAIGTYAAVLHALNNMDRDLLCIAKDDELGRKLQDLALPVRKRAPKNRGDF